MIKKIIIAIIILIGVAILFMSMAIPDLRKERYRDYNPVAMSESLKSEIKTETNNLTTYDIVAYSKDKTRKLLRFGTTCEPFNDRKVTKMHCVGYAQVYSTICNYAFQINNIKGEARPVVGIVKWNGINLNYFSKFLPKKWENFTKDHDFVEVRYENYVIYVDPTLNVINFKK